MKALAGVLFLFAFVQVVPAAAQNGRCDLPQGLQREVTTKYPGRKLVTISDLQEDDRTFFQKDHGDSCPGLVQVDFYGDGKPTFAMVLLTKDNSELVVAHRVGETWRSTVLGTGGPNDQWCGAFHLVSTQALTAIRKFGPPNLLLFLSNTRLGAYFTHGRETRSERFGLLTNLAERT